MITMKGKYNSANILIDNIDDTTREQIQEFLNHPAFANSYIAIMPDCHKGIGAVIGMTMKMNDYIIPNIVGVDIGCGVLSCNVGKLKIDLPKFDEFIKTSIPSGFSVNPIETEVPPIDKDAIINLCYKIGYDPHKAFRSIGSLGGGNHFIELGKSTSGDIWFTIHSGSRNFGNYIATYFQKKAKENLAKYFLKDEYRNLEFLPLDTEDGQDYLAAVAIAQNFAHSNRDEIMNRILGFLGCNFCESDLHDAVESVHNYIDIQNRIIRKGAISAQAGERCVIPFNMRDGLAICEGKGNSLFNFSAPHGAGRILSRTKAKGTLTMEAFKKTMDDAGIFTTTATEETLDESPEAYKDTATILEAIYPTVKVIEMVNPIYNFKAGE